VKAWTYWINHLALRDVLSLRRADQWRAVAVFEQIRELPFSGDDSIEDIHGRWSYLRVTGPFVVTYYEDHPEKHLLITTVTKVGARR
jgi:hypothetical protein